MRILSDLKYIRDHYPKHYKKAIKLSLYAVLMGTIFNLASPYLIPFYSFLGGCSILIIEGIQLRRKGVIET